MNLKGYNINYEQRKANIGSLFNFLMNMESISWEYNSSSEGLVTATTVFRDQEVELILDPITARVISGAQQVVTLRIYSSEGDRFRGIFTAIGKDGKPFYNGFAFCIEGTRTSKHQVRSVGITIEDFITEFEELLHSEPVLSNYCNP